MPQTTWRSRIVETGTASPSDLTANPKNWRKHPRSQADALSGVLDEVGWVQDVIVNRRTGNLVDGHLRVEIAAKTGQTEIPVTYVDLSEAEEALILATFDPISAMATADAEILRDLLDGVSSGDAAVQAMIADLAEREGVIDVGGTDGLTDPDEVPEPPAVPITQPGDLWTLGRHRLLCGDSTTELAVAAVLDGLRVNVIVTSPPYNQQLDTFKPSGMLKENTAFVDRMASAYADSLPEPEYQRAQVEQLEMLARFVNPNGSIFYNHKNRYRDKRVVSPMEWLGKLSFPIRQEIIWSRPGSVTQNARMFLPSDERIYWLRVGDDFVFHDTTEIKSWSTVWEIAPRNDVAVSAPFPREIPKRCIAATTAPGDIILDPYMGSGTTLIAAEELGRVAYGIEINPAYCDVIVKRWEAFTGQTATREATA